MKLTRIIIAGSLVLGGIAAAGVPVRPSSQNYQHLVGLMTTPAKKVPESPRDPLTDWQLAGVSEVEGGYLITLSHRSKAGDTVIIRPAGVQVLGSSAAPAGTLTVERVDFAVGDWGKTVVHLKSDGQATTVRFPDPLPVPAPATAPAPKPDRPLPVKPNKLAYPQK